MFWIVLIYIAGMVAFNLHISGDNDMYWAIQYYFFVHGMIALLAFNLRKNTFIKTKRKIYLILGLFSTFYALYHVAALSCKTMNDFLGYIDSPLWSIISGLIALILLISYFYDKNTKHRIN
jgi:hypothetical protein